MTDHAEASTSIHDALQGFLDEQAGVDENGNGVELAGYAAVVLYVRPDGTTGLTVAAPYVDAEPVHTLLGQGRDLVGKSLPKLISDPTYTSAEPRIIRPDEG